MAPPQSGYSSNEIWIELEFGNVGFSSRGENRSTRRKTSRSREENHQQTCIALHCIALHCIVLHCIYIAHFLYIYIQMRFTTLCGGLCQTALWRSSQSFKCRMSVARPQLREPHALLNPHITSSPGIDPEPQRWEGSALSISSSLLLLVF